MIERFEIKIVRLNNGEDIVGFCYIDEESKVLHLKYPKTFYINYDDEFSEETILIDWLAKSAFYSQEIAFDANNILFDAYPNIEFGYEYLKSIKDHLDPNSDVSIKINETISEIESDMENVPEGSYIVH